MSTDKEKRALSKPRVPEAQGEVRAAADLESANREGEGVRVEAEKYKDLYLRARADLDNQQKRMAREIETRAGFAKDALIRALLPVKDGLEVGLERTATVADPAVTPFREGMEVALRGWDGAFAAAGIEQINPLGQPFDPERHEALSVRPPTGLELPNTVVEVSQKGYSLDGRLIRPALVVVAQNRPH